MPRLWLTKSSPNELLKNNWGQINIKFQSVGAKAKGADNNWGQININLVNKWGQININLLGT